MKVIHKFFVIALLLSLIFSVSAVAAADNLENMTFEQSNMDDVSSETMTVSPVDQGIGAVEDESSVVGAEDQLKASNNDLLSVNDGIFSDIQTKIDRCVNGGTIYLNGETYIATDNNPIKINKSITIIGGSSFKEDQCAVLDANGLGQILSISSSKGNEITVILKHIIFKNGASKSSYTYGGAIRANANLHLEDCHFINNSAYAGGAIYCTGSATFRYYSDYYSYFYYYCESYWTNNYNNFTSYYQNKYGMSPDAYFRQNYGMSHDEYFDHFYTLDFKNCTFENNKATSNYGGAIYLTENSDVMSYGYDEYYRIYNCTFVNNYARQGGAIYGDMYDYNYAYETGIINSTFINNNAESGGAIYTHKNPTINCTFINNHATKGGAIYGINLVSNSQFINNSADYGGALYVNWGSLIINNTFTNNKALNSSSAMYFHSTTIELKGNVVNSDKCEIYVRNDQYRRFANLNIVILDNRTVQFCEGKITIYALVTDDMENKVSCENFTFLVGEKEFTTQLVDSIAKIEYDAKLSDTGTIVSYKPYKYESTKNVYNGKLEIIPFGVVIDFEDITGYMGQNIQIPISIHDASGHPLSGKFKAYYNGNDQSIPFTNGQKNFTLSLPSEITSFELTIEYEGVYATHMVYVLEAPSVVPVIDVAQNETGIAGRTLTIPVSVHDEDGNPLKGDITVSYNGQEKTLTLINGQIDVLIGLPVYETVFEVSFSYNGKSAFCLVTVENPIVETKANVTVPEYLSGNISNSIIIPISVKDEAGNPLKGNVTIYYNSNKETRTLTNGETNFVLILPNHETSFEVIVDYKGNIGTCQVEAIDPVNHTDVIIKVNENFTGEPGKSVTIPITVENSKGEALKGNISISYLGQDKTYTLVDGKVDVVIGLPLIESSFEVIFTYKNHVKSTTVNVVDSKPHNTVVPVITMPESRKVQTGKTIIIPVEVRDEDGNPLEGEITIYYNNKEFTQKLDNGTTNIIISSQPSEISFEVTVAYNGYMAHCMVEVADEKPVVTSVVIILPQNESGHVGNTIVIPVRVLDENGNPLEGEIQAYFNGHIKTETLRLGNASILMELPNTPMSYHLNVFYNNVNKDCLITVLPENGTDVPTNDTTVQIDFDNEIIGFTGKTKIIPVFVHDGNGKGLEGDIYANYLGNNRKYALTNGNANVIIGLPVDATTFELTIDYEGIFHKSSIVKVIDPANPMGNTTNVVSNNGTVVIPFADNATGEVNVIIGGKTYPGIIIDGKIVVNITDLPNGEYDAKIDYSGDENYPSSDKNITIEINDSPIVDEEHPLANVSEVESNGDGYVVIPFPNDATGVVTVEINGKNYTGKVVDGKVILDMTDLPAGNHTSIIYYHGDQKYSNSTKTIVIIKDSNAVSPTNPMGNITEAKTNDDGSVEIDFPKDANGDVYVDIGGNIYKGKVVDGKLVLDTKDLPKGEYNATVVYMGDGKYSSSTRTMTIIIRETSNNNNNQSTVVNPPAVVKASKFTAKKKTLKAAKKVKKYSVTLKSGKTPIGKVKVTIKIGKKTFKAKTNAKGKATFKIKKFTVPGKYKAVIKFKGNAQYKPTTKKVKLTIK